MVEGEGYGRAEGVGSGLTSLQSQFHHSEQD